MMNSSKSQIVLTNFIVFNCKLGDTEGEEHKKIVYYHPSNVDIDKQIKSVGLCEAVIKFTSTFNPDKQCEVLHTSQAKQYFLEVEDDFWIIMTIGVPYTQRAAKDGRTVIEYHGDEVNDNVYQAILKNMYNMYKLFMGTFDNAISSSLENIDLLKEKLNHFYSKFLVTQRLQHADISDIHNGIQYLPLDKSMFLRVQSFINYLETTFSQVKYTAFLYNDHLVWSGLEQQDMQVMYRYLTSSLFPVFLESELRGGVLPGRSATSPFSQPHYGRFVTGPPNIADTTNLGRVMKIFVNTNVKAEECHLLVYRALSANVCILVDASFELNFEFYKKLDNFLGPQLTTLASDIGEQYSRRPHIPLQNNEMTSKYIYFNHINFAQKTTVHLDNKRTGNVGVPHEIIKLVADFNNDLHKLGCSTEIMAKTTTDYWVVAKYSDERELYTVGLQKTATLTDINEEVKRLCVNQFTNLFLLE